MNFAVTLSYSGSKSHVNAQHSGDDCSENQTTAPHQI